MVRPHNISVMEEPTLVAATRFKAKCLEFLKEVHDRKRNCIVITKRGKPYAKLVPIEDEDAAFHGCLSGLATYSGDLTEPTGGDWEALDD